MIKIKYFLYFLVFLSFLGPSADSEKSFSNVLSDVSYNYITCLDSTFNYLVENVDGFSRLSEIPYEKAYKKVMENRNFKKHLVSSGETLDDIIKKYNSKIDDIEDFRKVTYKENDNVVSKDYQLQAGSYITIPSE
ncbi:MAG: hypothetical protein ACRDD7_17420 [Peptostreptococcaceae bacterium]